MMSSDAGVKLRSRLDDGSEVSGYLRLIVIPRQTKTVAAPSVFGAAPASPIVSPAPQPVSPPFDVAYVLRFS